MNSNSVKVGYGAGGGVVPIRHDHRDGVGLQFVIRQGAVRESFINAAALTTTVQQARGRYIPSIVLVLYFHVDVV